MKKKSLYCPFGQLGCETETQRCMFWRPRLGCKIEALIESLRAMPNQLKRIEERLEEGNHLT